MLTLDVKLISKFTYISVSILYNFDLVDKSVHVVIPILYTFIIYLKKEIVDLKLYKIQFLATFSIQLSLLFDIS